MLDSTLSSLLSSVPALFTTVRAEKNANVSHCASATPLQGGSRGRRREAQGIEQQPVRSHALVIGPVVTTSRRSPATGQPSPLAFGSCTAATRARRPVASGGASAGYPGDSHLNAIMTTTMTSPTQQLVHWHRRDPLRSLPLCSRRRLISGRQCSVAIVRASFFRGSCRCR